MHTQVKTPSEIENMRVSGKMLAQVLDKLRDVCVPGIMTKELSDFARKELNRLGGKPAFLGYHDFPDVLCTSVNEEVVHGIPSNRKLSDGDIISLDYGVNYKGMITDSAISLVVGKSNNEANRIVAITKRAMEAGIDQLRDGVRVGDIGYAVQKVLESAGYGVVRELVGHGVGHELHEEPNIPNYGAPGSGPVLKAGMTIAIEPMSTIGNHDVFVENDGWTVKTVDNSLSAHFEHTVLITENGAEILTTL